MATKNKGSAEASGPSDLGKAIAARRKTRNMTMAALSRKSGVAESVLSRLESGKAHGVSYGTALKIAKALRCNVESLSRLPDAPAVPA